ncbi:adenosylcobinamide-GDP ribazoletransferase [Butyrivibrio sp. YAB3001]|uniref:adenosylcobinamide-GDP ribazoletransferase n=1 Tax=Butyrivibrio sp. YAB3001 TaxID=1520812 RepID=UPI0008F676AA|nr:adenosylcobinamide-GDP ribazoletransferase [Butyrivibrio sp. YAB3001]SFC55154.1 cobalamin-5'-phosphate synthase [Butyrivibrio sp. YAB3001]
MNLFKSIAISFSLYSKIPMPIFEWKEENYKHAIAFLPLVGMVIGIISFVLSFLCSTFHMPVFFVTAILTLVPVFLTGGFHLDGFMDVQDALHSYQPREKKLEIMKDPHIGAFAVIGVGALALMWLGFMYLLVDRAFLSEKITSLWAFCGIYPLVRAFCGLSSILFKNAKKDGMLSMETGKSGKLDVCLLSVQGIASFLFMLFMNVLTGICALAGVILFTFWYKKMCQKQFGGVTGDTAGFFVVAGEVFLLMVISFLSL